MTDSNRLEQVQLNVARIVTGLPLLRGIQALRKFIKISIKFFVASSMLHNHCDKNNRLIWYTFLTSQPRLFQSAGLLNRAVFCISTNMPHK